MGVLLTVRYLRILSSRFCPMPFMASKSSTLLNEPLDLRVLRIFCAVDGPMPGTSSNSDAVAVLILMGCDGGFFFATKGRQTHRNKRATEEQRMEREEHPRMP